MDHDLTTRVLVEYFTNNSSYKQAEVKSYYSNDLADRQTKGNFTEWSLFSDLPEMIENESEELLSSQSLLVVQ